MANVERESAEDSVEKEESWLRELARAPGRAPPASATTAPAIHASEPAPPPPEMAVGTVMDGRYRLDEVLGAGGMGVVYAATQLQTGKEVAIKRMRPCSGEGSYGAAERFVREARAAAKIRHPNVVDVYDIGGDPGAPFLVMERLRGRSLRDVIAERPLELEEMKVLFAPVLHALTCAHQAGVMHRDLKPDNLFLVTQPDGSRLLKVLDFGISRLLSDDDTHESLTRTGALVGTPWYMPIERLVGEDDTDPRSDVYALGIVLYEALSGARPYPTRSAVAHAAALPTTKPTSLSMHRPELAGQPEDVIMRAIAFDRQDRFPSMEAFRDALLACERSTEGPRPRRSRRWLASGLAATALLTGVFVSVSFGEHVAPPAAELPVSLTSSVPMNEEVPARAVPAHEEEHATTPGAAPTMLAPAPEAIAVELAEPPAAADSLERSPETAPATAPPPPKTRHRAAPARRAQESAQAHATPRAPDPLELPPKAPPRDAPERDVSSLSADEF